MNCRWGIVGVALLVVGCSGASLGAQFGADVTEDAGAIASDSGSSFIVVDGGSATDAVAVDSGSIAVVDSGAPSEPDSGASCIPTTCAQLYAENLCGVGHDDGCGGMVTCGTNCLNGAACSNDGHCGFPPACSYSNDAGTLGNSCGSMTNAFGTSVCGDGLTADANNDGCDRKTTCSSNVCVACGASTAGFGCGLNLCCPSGALGCDADMHCTF